MSKNREIMALYDMADKFINLANILMKDDNSGSVGAGMRFAAARYSAFELSVSGRDLAKEKEAIKEELLKDYALMLDENLDVYIKHQSAEFKKAKNETKLKVYS